MRKYRNATKHHSARYARRPDGLPNRALLRSMPPLVRLLDMRLVMAKWAGIAGALFGAPPKP